MSLKISISLTDLCQLQNVTVVSLTETASPFSNHVLTPSKMIPCHINLSHHFCPTIQKLVFALAGWSRVVRSGEPDFRFGTWSGYNLGHRFSD